MAERDPDVFGGKWANRDLFALDADVTVYWPDVRPCYDAARPPEGEDTAHTEQDGGGEQ